MDPMSAPASRLPQLHGSSLVTDGGMETDLIFHHGVDLPHFAAFPLVDSVEGRTLLENYYGSYAKIAQAAGAGLLLESATWRASPDWGNRLGYSGPDLDRVNRSSITMLARLRERYAATVGSIVLAGVVGPRGDGYQAGPATDPAAAAAYHGPQVEAFAQAGADMVSALTLTGVGEAIGIVHAARRAGLPVAISFTVETDGRLPSGVSLAAAIAAVDEAGGPDYFLVNCAHPGHIRPALAEEGPWRARISGLRYNASEKSHAELDDAAELDEGDPAELAAGHDRLSPLLPRLSVLGGCCGTDWRHVARLWGVGLEQAAR